MVHRNVRPMTEGARILNRIDSKVSDVLPGITGLCNLFSPTVVWTSVVCGVTRLMYHRNNGFSTFETVVRCITACAFFSFKNDLH